MEINLDLLTEILDTSLDRPVTMGNWTCDTHGCLIGNHAIFVENSPFSFILTTQCPRPFLSALYTQIGQKLGVSTAFSTWLFGIETPSGFERFKYPTKKSALSRLAKFILYHRRKKELLADYEAARRMGDVDVAGYVESNLKEMVGV